MRHLWIIVVFILGVGSIYAQDMPTATLTTEYPSVYSVHYNADGSQLATISLNKNAEFFVTSTQIWDANTLSLLGTLRQDAFTIYKLAFNPTAPYIVTTSTDGQVSLWSATNFALVNTVKGHEASPDVQFSPDGTYFVTADWSGVVVWSAATFEPLFILNSRNETNAIIPPVAISPDSQYLAWVSLPANIVIVRLDSGEEVVTVATNYDIEPYRIAFTPDNALALAYGTLEIWDIASQQRLTRFITEEAVSTADYRPNHAEVAVLEADGVVKLWDTTTTQLIKILHEDGNPAWDIAFNPDGTHLAIGLDNASVMIYTLE